MKIEFNQNHVLIDWKEIDIDSNKEFTLVLNWKVDEWSEMEDENLYEIILAKWWKIEINWKNEKITIMLKNLNIDEFDLVNSEFKEVKIIDSKIEKVNLFENNWEIFIFKNKIESLNVFRNKNNVTINDNNIRSCILWWEKDINLLENIIDKILILWWKKFNKNVKIHYSNIINKLNYEIIPDISNILEIFEYNTKEFDLSEENKKIQLKYLIELFKNNFII